MLQLILIYPGRDLTVVWQGFPAVRPVMQARVRGQQFGRVLWIYRRSDIYPPNGHPHVSIRFSMPSIVPPVLPVRGLDKTEQLHRRWQRTAMAILEDGDDVAEQFFFWKHDALSLIHI